MCYHTRGSRSLCRSIESVIGLEISQAAMVNLKGSADYYKDESVASQSLFSQMKLKNLCSSDSNMCVLCCVEADDFLRLNLRNVEGRSFSSTSFSLEDPLAERYLPAFFQNNGLFFLMQEENSLQACKSSSSQPYTNLLCHFQGETAIM